MEKILNKKMFGTTLIFLLAFSFGATSIYLFSIYGEMNKTIDEKTKDHLFLMQEIQEEMRQGHNYQCCLMKPCASCVSLTPWHGDGAACECLSDIMNGKKPCGECTGGILAGRGNPLIAKYFALAIADNFQGDYLPELKQIMFEKYGVAIEEQK